MTQEYVDESSTAPLTRRDFLVRSIGVIGASALLPACAVNETRTGTLLSAFEDARGNQYVGGLSLADSRVFGAQVPMRAHGCALDPSNPQRALFFARRPGTEVFELDLATQRARTLFATDEGRHLSGHGVFSASGDLLFTPEHDYEHARGVIAVREMNTFAIVREIDTRGIDPHEIAWLPGRKHLLVANGGIMTHPRTFRRKLNIDTMDPSLCVIDAYSGECLEQWRLPDHLLSIRHLSIGADGSAAVGLQYQDETARAPGIVALYEPNKGMRLLEMPESDGFAGYVASVCMSADVVAATCPYGTGIARWSRSSGRFIDFVAAEEAYGLSRDDDGVIYASQRDGRALKLDKVGTRSHFVKVASTEPIRWDDHWVAVT